MTDHEPATVLVVDDEQAIADLYATWLSSEYTVRTAYTGRAALDRVDPTVDVVFLDRQMPEMTGDEVLGRIRDSGIECRVVMVTAVDPDFDLVDLAVDDYLRKPVRREDLITTMTAMRERSEYAATVKELFALSSRKATLEDEKSACELRTSPEYADMVTEFSQLKAEADTVAPESREDFESLLRDLPST